VEKNNLNWLMWFLERIGLALAIASSLIYLAIVYILIEGFETAIQLNYLLVFIGLGAVVGVLVSLSLRIQGIVFAKTTKLAKEQLKELTELKGKSEKVKLYPMWVWFLGKFILDVLFKGITVATMLYFSISIIYEGIKDYTYMWLAITNVMMFMGFGLMSLSSGYDRYINYQMPYLQQIIEKLKKEKQ